MDFQELIATLFQAFMTAAIPVISAFLIRFINSQNKNEMVKKYLAEATDAVSKAVLYVSQTYVDTLKENGKWDAETKKNSF